MSHIDYMRQLAVAALASEPGTSTEVAERMRLLAEGHGHSAAVVRQINPQSASGHVRALHLSGALVVAEMRHSRRHGRDEPVYQLAADYDGPRTMPMEPDDDEDDDRLRGLTRSQVLALLSANELYTEMAATHLRQLQETNFRARKILEENGLL
jgi:hypothetical protein